MEIGMVEHLPKQFFRAWVRAGHAMSDRRGWGFLQAIDPQMK
jgi:hypothetical protein